MDSSNTYRTTAMQIAISAAGSGLFATLVWIFRDGTGIPTWLFFVSHVALGVTVFGFTRAFLRSSWRGRETAMKHNVAVLSERKSRPPGESLICSTRFTHWPPSEQSPVRSAFRSELSAAILREGREVRRIWYARSSEDAQRMTEIIQSYTGHSNFSLRMISALRDYPLPEILVVNDRVASISLPQPIRPSGVASCVAMRDRRAVRVFREYFDLLWNGSQRVIEAGQVVQDAYEFIRQRAEQPHYTSPPDGPRSRNQGAQ